MRKLLLNLITLVFIFIAWQAFANKSQHRVLVGTIAHFECGDNCYLTITDNKGKEHMALCDDRLCETLMTATGANLGGYKGKKVKVSVGTGKQVDGSGTVMGTMDAFVKIKLIK